MTAKCRQIFVDKMKDYGPSWRIFRLHGITDQLYIKACNIRQRQETGVSLVGDEIDGNLRAIVNYGIIALIQLELGYAEKKDLDAEEVMELYDKYAHITLELMKRKNHDYDEAWRAMRVSSYTDLILMKIYRTKEIESNDGLTLVSEGVDANYMDMINYSVFALIKMDEENGNF